VSIIGCDIHCFVEKRMADGSWEQITDFVSDYYDPDNDYFQGDSFAHADCPLDGRNYSVFAVMADVRNGLGFAGCDTGDAIEPIAMPKGLPDDCCAEIRKESDEWDCDGHSHSHLSVAEIMAYDPDTPLNKRGIVSPSEYAVFKEKGQPESWCGMVSGPGIIIVNEDKIEQTIKNNPEARVYAKVAWTVPVKDYCSSLFVHALDQLKKRCDSHEMDDVRLVFWFDN